MLCAVPLRCHWRLHRSGHWCKFILPLNVKMWLARQRCSNCKYMHIATPCCSFQAYVSACRTRWCAYMYANQHHVWFYRRFIAYLRVNCAVEMHLYIGYSPLISHILATYSGSLILRMRALSPTHFHRVPSTWLESAATATSMPPTTASRPTRSVKWHSVDRLSAVFWNILDKKFDEIHVNRCDTILPFTYIYNLWASFVLLMSHWRGEQQQSLFIPRLLSL